MALDSRIPLMAEGWGLEPRANALMRGLNIVGARDQNALRQMQMQQMQQAAQQAMAEREQQAKRQQEIDAYLASMSGQAGPPQPFNPVEALMRTKSPEMVKQLQGVFQPQKKLTTVAPGAALVDEATGQPVYTAPDREAKSPAAVQEYEYAKQQGYKGSFQDWTTQKAKAGATSVSVNTGQKGLDNTLKLRGDFRQEPVYKAHQEMQSAYAQIKQALGQASPAGDLAGATKIMKLLDPGSVVRESELGMAMAASGLLDRVENYAQNILNGTKLTPTQRADFQKLADALYSESVGQYNAKRGEYQGIAERNQLPVMDVLGPESSAPGGGWSIKPKGK